MTIFLLSDRNTSGSWENKKCCGNTSRQASVPTAFSTAYMYKKCHLEDAICFNFFLYFIGFFFYFHFSLQAFVEKSLDIYKVRRLQFLI